MLPLSSSSSKSFNAYPRSLDFDIELGTSSSITYKRQPRKLKSLSLSSFYSIRMMIRSFGNRMQYFTKLHPILALLICLSFGITVLVLLSRSVMSSGGGGGNSGYYTRRAESYRYPFGELRNLVMVAGHSVYVSSSCGNVDSENSWFLESYQRNPGQAATFVTHIKEGVQVAARDSDALLLFSGGETRKDAGPRSEAQSYWAVAEGLGWFGEKERVKWRALTEEHARDSFENLLFSVCRFRELTGTYPQNITVVGYDFKEERFAHLHRSAIGFPKSRFFYSGTPATSTSKAVALKGEALVRTQFQEDPYGCRGQLFRKKLGRDPFHRSIPYPSGCPEIEGLFKYCGIVPYPGYLPWA